MLRRFESNSRMEVKKEKRGRPKKSEQAVGAVGGAAAPAPASDVMKAPKPPKPAKTAMELYVAERAPIIRKETPQTPREAQEHARQEWLALDDDEQAPWVLKEQKSADNFARAHAKYLAKRREWRMQYDDHDEYEDEEEDDEFRGRRRRRAGRGGERGAAFNRNRAELARQEEEARRPLKKPKKKKDPNAPKKGLNAYMFFSRQRVKELRALDSKAPQKELLKKASEEWNAFSVAQKQPFLDMSLKDKERHEKELADYIAKQH